MLRTRWHIAWLVVWFVATLAYTAWFLFRVFAVGINVNGPFTFALFLMVFYTVPVVGTYFGGLALAWLVPKAMRIPSRVVGLFGRAAESLDEAVFGFNRR